MADYVAFLEQRIASWAFDLEMERARAAVATDEADDLPEILGELEVSLVKMEEIFRALHLDLAEIRPPEAIREEHILFVAALRELTDMWGNIRELFGDLPEAMEEVLALYNSYARAADALDEYEAQAASACRALKTELGAAGEPADFECGEFVRFEDDR